MREPYWVWLSSHHHLFIIIYYCNLIIAIMSFHSNVINCRRTVGLIFCTKNMKVFQNDNVTIDNYKMKFVSKVSYLGVHLNSTLCDDEEIDNK